MKEFLHSLLKTTEERIKNPFIGAFMTSWILFNWKPIVMLFFSSKNIDVRISYIEENFNDLNSLLWFPVIAAVFYVLILPYMSLFFDILLRYSMLKRNEIVINKQKQNIENQKQLAIEEIKLEEAKTEFRERKTHNKLVEDLQNRNKDLENEILSLKSDFENREKMNKQELKNFELRYKNSRDQINGLNHTIFEKDQELQSLKDILGNRERNKSDRSRSILRFENGMNIIQEFDGNRVTYYNRETNQKISDNEVKKLKDNYPFELLYY